MKKILSALLLTAVLCSAAFAADLPAGYQVKNGYNPADFVSKKNPSEFRMAVIVKGVVSKSA